MLKIKEWESYQSYKDRKPPWIRLHRKILDNYQFHKMSSNARALLPMLWLLASEDEDPISGTIKTEFEEIAFRLRLAIGEIEAGVKECISAGFIEEIESVSKSVTDPLRNCHETVTPETETETEEESTPPVSPSVSIRTLGEIEKHRLDGHYAHWFEENAPLVDRFDLREELILYCRSTGKKYRDYWATLQTWARRRQKETEGKSSGSRKSKIAAETAALLEQVRSGENNQNAIGDH